MDTPNSVPLQDGDFENAPAQPTALSQGDFEDASSPAAQSGPVNPYAKSQDWRDAYTQTQPLDTKITGNKLADVPLNALANVGSGGLSAILHPVDTATGIVKSLYHAGEAATGDTADFRNDIGNAAQAVWKKPGEAIPALIGQTAVLGGAGEAAGSAIGAMRGASPVPTVEGELPPAAEPPAATPPPAGPGTPPMSPQDLAWEASRVLQNAGKPVPAPLEMPTPGVVPKGASMPPAEAPRWMEPAEEGARGALQPRGGLQTETGDAGGRTTQLELEPTPQGSTTPLLDQIVKEWEANGSGAGAPPPQSFISQAWGALRDAVSRSGQAAGSTADLPRAQAAQAASISLDQIAEQFQAAQSGATPPPNLFQIGHAYIQSVLAGIAPAAAAAALGMTPEHQEMAHVAHFFMPGTLTSLSQSGNPGAHPQPPAPAPQGSPDAATIQSQANAKTVTEAAGQAAIIQRQAAQIAAGVPPPKAPQLPTPQGMDQGALTQQTVDRAVQIIHQIPQHQQPVAIRETVESVAAWALNQKTPIGPDGQVESIYPPNINTAQAWAVKIINAEVDRQHQMAQAKAEAAQKAQQDQQKAAQKAAADRQKDAETARQEADDVLSGKKAEGTAAGQVSIPENAPGVIMARKLLEAAGPGHTAKKLDELLRNNVAISTAVRDALVQEHVHKHALKGEDKAQEQMTGQPLEEGKSREELQDWADKVAKGEHPYMHIPNDMEFNPAGVEKLAKTKVTGAGKFGGTYYHDKKIKPEEIRKAARDKENPQGALNALEAKWRGGRTPIEVKPEEIEEENPKAVEEPKPSPAEALKTEEAKPAESPTPSKPKGETITNSGVPDVDASTKLLTIKDAKKAADKLLGEILGPDVVENIPPFVREKLVAASGALTAVTTDPRPEWNLKAVLLDAISAFDDIFRHGTARDTGPLVTALVKALDGPPEALRSSLVNFAQSAQMKDAEPWFDFNASFGAELTKEQYLEQVAERGKKQESPAVEPEGRLIVHEPRTGLTTVIPEEQPAAPRPIQKGDKVSYKTNKGKTRTGEVAWTDGKKVRVKDGESTVNKNISEVELTSEVPAADSPLTGRDAVLPNQPSKGNANLYGAAVATLAQGMSIGTPQEPLFYPERGLDVYYNDGKWSFRNASLHEAGSQGGWTVAVPDVAQEIQTAFRSGELENERPVKAEPAADATLVDALQLKFEHGAGPKNYNDLKKIVTEFDGSEPDQIRMKEAQEAYEAMLNRVASEIVNKNSGGAHEVFDRLTRLYEGQPNLSIRTSTSIANQAYSTPLPLAFIADRFAGIDKQTTVYEPTAGNGALLIAANPATSLANELNPARLQTLKDEGFLTENQDASQWSPAQTFDAVVANPPFGNLPKPVVYDGYEMTKLDHLIAAKALSTMKNGGKACIILGAGDRDEAGKVTDKARPFFNWLYAHYSVVSDFELDGDLYAKQGAKWPVRVIAIDGRVRSAKVSPLPAEIKRLKTWGEVYDRASEYLGPNLRGKPKENAEPGGPMVRPESTGTGGVSGRPVSVSGRTDSQRPQASGTRPGSGGRPEGQPGPVVHTGAVPDPELGSADITVRPDGDVARSDRLADGEPARRPAAGHAPQPDRNFAEDLADESNPFQSVYQPYSSKKDVMVMAPKSMLQPMWNAMEHIASEVGDIDEYVTSELGYKDVETMQEAFMGLQTDAVAAAIYNISHGKGTIVADQTGVGKGRIAAAMIRWAEMHGKLPIFVTASETLYSDIWGDLTDIGSDSSIRPQIFNSGSAIIDPVTERELFATPGSMRPVLERIAETGDLPQGMNAAFLTYSQINTADNRQQMALRKLMPGAILIMDEIHNAGGDSTTGHFMQNMVGLAGGVLGLSATYAKRPDNMPIFAAFTDISIAIPDPTKVEGAIIAGGAPLQAATSNMLAEAGQLVRRERSFDGIKFTPYVDSSHREEHEKISDEVTHVLRAILEADGMYHDNDFEHIAGELAAQGEAGGHTETNVTHQEFSSLVHNFVRQILLALKAEDAAGKMIQEAKGWTETLPDGSKVVHPPTKPILALENTMGSFLEAYVDYNDLRPGDSLQGLKYSDILDRALRRTRYVRVKPKEGGKATRIEIPLERLSPATRKAYAEAQRLIDKLTVDIPVSPIDFIKNKLEQAGIKTGEITGREYTIDYSGKVPKLGRIGAAEKKKTERVRTATRFNNGELTAMVINAAGATGISLHASVKFRDKTPRHMIVIQPAGDVNIVMQMFGRINRTGQVQLPQYTMMALDLPSELRPQANLARKMNSLNAQVTANTKSATSLDAVDFFNKYGDETVALYLSDNVQMAKALGVKIETDKDGVPKASENLAMKATGHSALLPVSMQRRFLEEITESYKSYIEYLDGTNQNDLVPKIYDFKAKEIRSEVVFTGTDKSSPFGQDAVYKEFSVIRPGKVMTPEEVTAALTETVGSEAMAKPSHSRYTDFTKNLIDSIEARYPAFLDHQLTAGARLRAQSTRTDAIRLLQSWNVGSGHWVEINGEGYNAIVTNVEVNEKPSGNPYVLSGIKVTLAVNGSLRAAKIPFNKLSKLPNTLMARVADISKMLHDQGESKKLAKIITGNVLAGYGVLKGPNSRGRIITFTLDDGTVQRGILMPAKFDAKENVSQEYALRSPVAAVKLLTENPNSVLTDADTAVQVWPPNNNRYYWEVRAAKSKSAGGKFFSNPDLLACTRYGDFVSRNGKMVAEIRDGDVEKAIGILMGLTSLYAPASLKNDAQKYDQEQAPAPKPTIRQMLSSEEGSFDPAAIGEYGQKAAAATLEDLLKAAKLSGRTMKAAGREVVAALYPRALASHKAKDIMGRGIGHPALTIFRASQLMEGISKMFNQMSTDEQIEFVDRWQTGKKQPTEELQNAQDLMQSIIEGQRETEQDAINLGRPKNKEITLLDKPNYFPNRYAKKPEHQIEGEELAELEEDEKEAEEAKQDAEKYRNLPPSRRPFEGSKRFLQQQKWTLKEAVNEGGAVPLGTPVDMLMRRLQEGAKFVAAKYVMHSFKKMHMVTFLRRGKKLPEGFVKIDDKIAKVWRPVETAEGGIFYKEAGEWVGQKDAMRLLNNYLSVDHIRGTSVGRGLVLLKNVTTAIRLAWSPFHWLTITVQNFSSGMNIGLDRLYNQGLRQHSGAAAVKALGEIGASMVAPYTAIKTGGRMIQYARNPDEFIESPEGQKFVEEFPDFPHLQQLLFNGGLRWGMPDEKLSTTVDTIVAQIKEGHIGKATLKFFPWLAAAVTKPLFEHYIPRSKWNFAVRMLSAKLQQYSEAIANGDMTEDQIARDVAAAADYRFGEFTFDSLYWNNTFKTIAQLTFRSVSWKAGSWLSAVKAVKEQFTSQAFDDGTFDRLPAEAERFGWMKGFVQKLPQLGINAGGLISLVMFSSILGGTTCYMATGHSPAYWAQQGAHKLGHTFAAAMAFECVHPRTGMVDAHGEPVRLTLPSDLKDFEHAYESPGRYVHGSLSDYVANSWDTLQNKDSLLNYVYNPQDPAYKEFVQGAMYNLKGDFLPMALQNIARETGPQDTLSRLEAFSGIFGAPKYMDRSVALNKALSEVKHEAHTPEEEADYLSHKDKPTRHEILQAAREKNMSYLDHVVLHDLTYAQAKDIFDNYASTSERETMKPIMDQKRINAVMKARAGR